MAPNFIWRFLQRETQAEPARRRRRGLLIESTGRTLVFGLSTRSTAGGGPTDTDSAAIIGCDVSAPLRLCVSALNCDGFAIVASLRFNPAMSPSLFVDNDS